MSLTTPVPRDEDTTFPGEAWFYYWKTSASLWRSKLAEYQKSSVILVPLNWSFHSETGDHYDFAQHRPETDLKKLSLVAKELGKEMVFLLPLAPAPFLPNGGLPHFLARTMALNEDGLAQFVVDADGSLNKIYSFFDNRVYQAFTKFTHQLAQYMSESGINCDIYGLRSFSYCPHQGVRDFFTDRSAVFEQSFARFLKAKREEIDFELASREEEEGLKKEYAKTIESLYINNASQALNVQWEGILNYCFLGARSDDSFSRLGNQHSGGQYSWEILEALTRDMVPSSVLLPPRVKKNVLKKELDDLVVNSFLHAKLDALRYDDAVIFKPLIHFELSDARGNPYQWEANGLLPFLKTHYPYAYSLKQEEETTFSQEHEGQEKLTFFLGPQMTKASFHFMLKLFMSGGKVILDRTGMGSEFLKKLEVFFIENSFKVEKINFHTSVHNISLGEGRLVVLEGERLSSLESAKVYQFWQKLLETFQLRTLSVEGGESLVSFWRTRAANSNELNYEEIRRLSLYNPSSYKRKAIINLSKNFVLMKVIDPVHAEVLPKKSQVEIMMMPDATASIDFGVFS